MKPLCMIPFTRAFVYADGRFRICCNTQEISTGQYQQSFRDWWHGDHMRDFRSLMYADHLPAACTKCEVSETMHGASFRTSVNDQNPDQMLAVKSCHSYPNSWHVMFGNICNLACWTCSENSSSVIATHKTKLQMMPLDFEDPNERFLSAWPGIRKDIMHSYQHHETVLITVLGGEPIYNPVVLDFLQDLVSLGLSTRTRIEITTNGTKLNDKIGAMLHRDNWQHVSLFVSVDATGDLGEAIRYGSRWKDVDCNIDFYKGIVNHLEIHTMISILNLCALPELVWYCRSKNLQHYMSPISYPWWFDIKNWDGDRDWIDADAFRDTGLIGYLHMLGSQARSGAKKQASQYVSQLARIRTEFQRSDHAFSHILGS